MRISAAGIFGAIVLAVAIVMAIFAPHIARYDPIAQDTNALLAPPSSAHPLGTDFLGRDTFSRLVFGARASLAVAFSATTIALVCGLIVGLTAGYSGGWIEGVLMRTMDGLLAFPALVLALAITASIGPSARNAAIAIGVTGIPAFARLVRGQVLA
ncbi:MAG: ABC transporter permease, partial [Vulcanimicrobiaceae bacterium]